MKLLLDTHAFLWWVWDDPRIPNGARRRIADPRNEVLVSAVSAWEIVLKFADGSLELSEPPDRFVPARIRENNFGVLPIQLAHVLRVVDLPRHHTDPFDRLLVAQASAERLAMVSADENIAQYAVRIVWD